ncbi:glycoside hydrolase superfamily [Emericellopsis atlantica]|uniref:glucan 1,3-beta-glucosidase n=1 Tax=Emericellopsis atlantica TaxID=2614577 RepID=A0A9P7ZGF5_9HYPO|nr:glycoside hydrolase superfamily [Emericellopsis atlantica]KAG9251456.1 glycoside hydrolase superfamily [Emericellopsis atlantica]
MPRRESSSRPRRDSSARPEGHGRRHESTNRDRQRKKRSRDPRPETSSGESRGSGPLSAEALARLERQNAREKRREGRTRKADRVDYHEVEQEPRRERAHRRERSERPKERTRDRSRNHGYDEERERELERPKAKKGKKKRVVSGAIMEEGKARPALRGGRNEEWRSSEQSFEKQDYYHRPSKKKKKKKLKKKWWIIGGISLVLLIIIIVAAVVVSQKKKGGSSESDNGDSSSSGGDKSNLDGIDRDSIPEKWRNTYLDPWSWETTSGFNVTFTDEMVGDLPIMGLDSEWDDSKRANDNVPPLNKAWGSYVKKPARGVNLGGWFTIEPFITPSLFQYPSDKGVIDEYTLSKQLGASKSEVIEKHYATFITEKDFQEIAEAGLDHVRIPYSYWAVEIYDSDPYLYRTSWRYLLRAIEWARKYGLRVNLDLHSAPGGQNGWNHSGREGPIGWLKGDDGQLNGQRSLDIHDRLSKFFAQDRYKNIITHYGLVNEPKMTSLDTDDVIQWTEKAYKMVRDNGVDAFVIFGDGFMGLDNWQGLMTGYDDLVLDVHQYVIFNLDLLAFTHQKKIQYACKGWTDQAELSMDPTQGYGPTLFAEWSQADTDCQPLLNGGVKGSRWDGTSKSVDGPSCPTKDDSCSCSTPLEDPSKWDDTYKKFLQMFAEAQMHSFEKGWGWWYWTWKTEDAPQWSYQLGLKAGILPEKAWDRSFNCDSSVPDFSEQGLSESY